MEKQPEEMDNAEQRATARSIAEHFDTLDEFAHEVKRFGHLGGGDVVAIYREAHGLDPRTGHKPTLSIQPFDKTLDVICPSCSLHFANERALSLHYSFDVPVGVGEGSRFNHPMDLAEAFPERRRCGNSNELLARGLKNDGTSNRIRNPVPDTWYS
jgi:hypothetical protein